MGVRAAGRPQGETSPATRERLVDAGLEVFARDGYEGATVTELVARAGVTPPVLYHHYGSKAGLYVATARHVMDLVVSALRPEVLAATDLGDCLSRMLSLTVELHTTEPRIAKFVGAPTPSVDTHADLAGLPAELGRTSQLYQEVAERHGPAPGADAQATADLIRTVFFGLTRVALAAGDDGERFERAADLLRATLLRGLEA